MTSSNVDLVRSIYAAWGSGDYSSAEWADPEIEFVMADGPNRGKWSGVAEMWKAWRAALSAVVDFRAKVTRLVVYFERKNAITDLALAPEPE
jgi:hypothetical protein